MEDIFSGKSIWDEDASSWISQLMEQAEEEARQMQEKEEQEKYFAEQQENVEEENLLMEEDDEFIDDDIIPIRNNTSNNNSYNNNSGSFSGIYKVEGARTGQPTNLNSSAIGRGQMIKGTRYAMYKKLGINNIEEAEQQYRSNPEFEEVVNNAYREELSNRIPSHIQGKEREYMIAKGWYTGNPFYDDNKVPHPEAGNRITAGEYARRAVRQYGGNEFIPSGILKQAQFGITNNKITYNGIVPDMLDVDNLIPDEEQDEKDLNLQQYLPQGVELLQEISKFAKEKKNQIISGIDNGLNTAISTLSNAQNDNNLKEYEKLLHQNRYNSIRPNQNKQTPYI